MKCDFFSSVIPDSTHTCSTLNPERYGFLSYVVIKQSPIQIRKMDHESMEELIGSTLIEVNYFFHCNSWQHTMLAKTACLVPFTESFTFLYLVVPDMVHSFSAKTISLWICKRPKNCTTIILIECNKSCLECIKKSGTCKTSRSCVFRYYFSKVSIK